MSSIYCVFAIVFDIFLAKTQVWCYDQPEIRYRKRTIPMEINEMIKKRRLELGLTLKDVAVKLGVAESTVLRYERKDIQNMGIDKIVQLAQVLKCSPADLLGWDTTQRITEAGCGADIAHDIAEESEAESWEEGNEETAKIKLLGSLPAGIPIDAVTDVIGCEEIPAAWLADGQQYIALKVKDVSMYPRYLAGDILIVRITPNCRNGGDALVYADGAEAVLRQIHHHDDGTLTLESYNPEYAPKTYPAGDAAILGVVVQMRRTLF
jgi:repressor LexA